MLCSLASLNMLKLRTNAFTTTYNGEQEVKARSRSYTFCFVIHRLHSFEMSMKRFLVCFLALRRARVLQTRFVKQSNIITPLEELGCQTKAFQDWDRTCKSFRCAFWMSKNIQIPGHTNFLDALLCFFVKLHQCLCNRNPPNLSNYISLNLAEAEICLIP